MKKNSRWSGVFAFLIVLFLSSCLLIPSAYAQEGGIILPDTPPLLIDPTTNNICPGAGLFTRLALCIQNSFLYATQVTLLPLSALMADVVLAACTLAIALWGFMALTGNIVMAKQRIFLVAAKVVFVLVFSWNFGSVIFGTQAGFYKQLLDIMNDLLLMVTEYLEFSYYTSCSTQTLDGYLIGQAMFERIDCTIDALVGGIFSGFSLTGGIVGFVLAALFSGAAGIFVASLTGALIVIVIFAFVRAFYIYLVSMMSLSLMVLISPFMVPLILFDSVKGFFDKWVRRITGFVVQVIFLFAYLSMLMAAFDYVVYGDLENPDRTPLALTNVLYPMDANECAALEVEVYKEKFGRVPTEEDLAQPDAPKCTLGHRLRYGGVYGDVAHGNQAINVNPRLAAGSAGLNTRNIHTGFDGAELETRLEDWKSEVGDIRDSFLESRDFYDVNILTHGIDWKVIMHKVTGLNAEDMTPEEVANYIVKLFMSLIMAVVTAYVFLIMLDFLPYVGSGVSGDVLGSVGISDLAPPGTGAMNSLKDSYIGKGMG